MKITCLLPSFPVGSYQVRSRYLLSFFVQLAVCRVLFCYHSRRQMAFMRSYASTYRVNACCISASFRASSVCIFKACWYWFCNRSQLCMRYRTRSLAVFRPVCILSCSMSAVVSSSSRRVRVDFLGSMLYVLGRFAIMQRSGSG